ncbi:unnamed protein product, partial [Arabidopsis halleri]
GFPLPCSIAVTFVRCCLFAFNKRDLSFFSVSYRVSCEMTHLSSMFIQVFYVR